MDEDEKSSLITAWGQNRRRTLPTEIFCAFPIAITDIIWYSVATLSSIIVIYRQVMPNHRKTGTFDGRKSQNHDIMGNPKKRKFIEFW